MQTFGGTSKFSIDWGYTHFEDVVSFDFKMLSWNRESTTGEPHFGTEGQGSVILNDGTVLRLEKHYLTSI